MTSSSNMYKDNWTQPWPMGSEIYPELHENPRAFFSSSSPILPESFIQYPWGVGGEEVNQEEMIIWGA